MTERTICVIIPAYNAEKTIAVAVRSALDLPEVSEVIVVDDASRDATGLRARTAAAGDPRLKVLRQDRNSGPSAARNLAIEHSRAPLIAILDADDFFLPGRFAPLLALPDWDLVADNIVFVPEGALEPGDAQTVEQPRECRIDTLDMAAFLRGNIPAPHARRGELGFLKPLISRDFLDKKGLRYDPDLRLGEDFKLYVEMLARGARFRVLSQIGYVAQVRPDSLSGHHSADDLGHLLTASIALNEAAARDRRSRRAMRDYLRALRARYLLHAFLQLKREAGLGRAARMALVPPRNFLPIARGVLRDKLTATFGLQRRPPAARRYLLPLE